MKIIILQTIICPLVLIVIICTSCYGQVNSNSISQQRLIKNQFSNKFQAAADNVHCGLQDKAGNLWFGTTGDGVYRFDGKLFTNFTMKDGLDTNQILSIFEDKIGNIWFGTRKGVCLFNGKTITRILIPAFNYNTNYPSISSNINRSELNGVWSIMQDKKGTIWFGTDEGVFCFNGKIFSRFLDNTNIINQYELTLKSIQYMLEDTKGNIWFGSGPRAFEGICFYDGKKLTNFKPKNQQWIRKIVEAKNGNLFFATRQAGICYYDPSSKQTDGKSFNFIAAPPKFIKGSLTNMLVDKAGNIWIASDYGNDPGDTLGGVWLSNIEANKIDEKKFIKITSKEVFFMLQDKNNNIWLGTRGTGLYRYDGKTFTQFSE